MIGNAKKFQNAFFFDLHLLCRPGRHMVVSKQMKYPMDYHVGKMIVWLFTLINRLGNHNRGTNHHVSPERFPR